MPTSAIDGVIWGAIQAHRDERGAFREIWRASSGVLDNASTGGPNAGFVQANSSASAAGVLRGLHYHRRQLDHWVVISGTVFVALVDVRSVMTSGRPLVETRHVGADATVTIPAGVAHGFLAIEPTELLYFVTNEYDGTDELGFAWDDPTVSVPWPRVASTTDGRPILSERDRGNPPLASLVAQLESA